MFLASNNLSLLMPYIDDIEAKFKDHIAIGFAPGVVLHYLIRGLKEFATGRLLAVPGGQVSISFIFDQPGLVKFVSKPGDPAEVELGPISGSFRVHPRNDTSRQLEAFAFTWSSFRCAAVTDKKRVDQCRYDLISSQLQTIISLGRSQEFAALLREVGLAEVDYVKAVSDWEQKLRGPAIPSTLAHFLTFPDVRGLLQIVSMAAPKGIITLGKHLWMYGDAVTVFNDTADTGSQRNQGTVSPPPARKRRKRTRSTPDDEVSKSAELIYYPVGALVEGINSRLPKQIDRYRRDLVLPPGDLPAVTFGYSTTIQLVDLKPCYGQNDYADCELTFSTVTKGELASCELQGCSEFAPPTSKVTVTCAKCVVQASWWDYVGMYPDIQTRWEVPPVVPPGLSVVAKPAIQATNPGTINGALVDTCYEALRSARNSCRLALIDLPQWWTFFPGNEIWLLAGHKSMLMVFLY